MLKGLGRILGKTGSGVLRFVLRLATGMGGTRLLLSIGSALVIASFVFLLEAPLLFRIPFFIGALVLAFVATSHLLRWLSVR
jgi:hypothetical protein